MRSKTFNKNTLRKFKNNFNRFLSIFFIMALGCAVFVGIASTGPDMLLMANKYFDEHKLADYRIISTSGFTEEDIEALEKSDRYSYISAGYGIDVLVDNTAGLTPARLHSLPNNEVNTPNLIDGRMPVAANEVLADSESQDKIGDVINITQANNPNSESILAYQEFTVVGITEYPYYIYPFRGYTNIADGQLDSFYLLHEEAFKSEYYLEIFLREKNTEGADSFSNAYDESQQLGLEFLQNIANERELERYQEVTDELNFNISQATSDLEEAKTQLSLSKDLAATEIQQLLLTATPEMIIEIEKKELEYEAEFSKAEEELSLAETELDSMKQYLYELSPPIWIVEERFEQPGYHGFHNSVKELEQLSRVFPFFFFIVALLVCLTTMTRIVDENRTQMGLLSAIGYSHKKIISEYLFYGAVSSLLGSLLGVIVGTIAFPYLIWETYNILCNMPGIEIAFIPEIVLFSILISVVCTSVATVFSCIKELGNNTASLIQPKSPRMGKSILLEKIVFLWNHFSFMQKITARNIFRYKKRLFMTVFGVAGCTALLLAGFGLNDTTKQAVENQYDKLNTYDVSAVLSQDTQDYSQIDHLVSQYGEGLYLHQHAVEVSSQVKQNFSEYLYLIVPQTPELLSNFIKFYDMNSDNNFTLENGAVLSSKLADVLGVTIGDTVTINYSEKEPVVVLVENITENYVNHYIYITPKLYSNLFSEEASFDNMLIKLTQENNTDKFVREFLELDQIIGAVKNQEVENEINNMLQGINSVVVLSIICAVALAVVVLYNLTNLNLTERKREIATLKVLGFYPKECVSYIYRESLILSIMGIVVGICFGIVLLELILNAAEVNIMFFSNYISIQSYIVSILITLSALGLVDLVLIKQITLIDGIESLKSVD